METIKDRLLLDRAELSHKLSELSEELLSGKIPDNSMSAVHVQVSIMSAYIGIIDIRLNKL